MKARDYEVVEERFNINVNVFGYENKAFPLYVSKKSNEQVLNVLLISSEQNSHCVFIKNFNRLMYSKIKHRDRKHFCMPCLQNFSSREILNNHRERCLLINDTQAVKYETGIIKFKNYEKQIPIPFKIYSDTECLLKRINISEGNYTKLYQKHIPNSIAAKLVCIDNKFTLPTIIFEGKNRVNKFIKWIFEQQKQINQIINEHFNKKLKMTIANENNYQNAQDCWICNEKLDETKVRDHCHIAGKYRGAAHSKCNLKLKIPRKIPIIFHNLEEYDGHIIFKELNNFNDIDIQVIPKTSEKYMSIIVNRNVFLDSLQFCKESLDKLASNLNNEDFKYLLLEFRINKLEILKRKDAYPYEWVDSYEKFNHQELPPKACFYSSINDGKRGKGDGNISNNQYLHLKSVWKEFNFNIFRDFRNHYLKKDVLLLADVFEKFISASLKNHNLDPCHYFSTPGLSWDAMLKMIKVELEKISKPDIHLFIEKGMRGGISYVAKRYSKANNKYCPDYDKTKPEKYIAYIDMNNLYGYAMSEYLPYGGFKWIKNNSQIINKILNRRDHSLHGYFLEVDLDYPENLHH